MKRPAKPASFVCVLFTSDLCCLVSSRTVLCLFLRNHGADAVDCKNKGEDHKKASNDGSYDTPAHIAGSSTGGDGGVVLDHSLYQGGYGNHQHEDHRDEEHAVLLAHLAKPGGNSQKTDSSKKLVGGTEERPDIDITCHTKADTHYNGNNRTKDGVGEDLLDTGDIGNGLTVCQPELLEGVTCQTGGGIQRCQAEYGDGKNQEGLQD